VHENIKYPFNISWQIYGIPKKPTILSRIKGLLCNQIENMSEKCPYKL
jgi:hypothetical protein